MKLIDVRSWHIAQSKQFFKAAHAARESGRPKKAWKKLYDHGWKHEKIARVIQDTLQHLQTLEQL